MLVLLLLSYAWSLFKFYITHWWWTFYFLCCRVQMDQLYCVHKSPIQTVCCAVHMFMAHLNDLIDIVVQIHTVYSIYSAGKSSDKIKRKVFDVLTVLLMERLHWHKCVCRIILRTMDSRIQTKHESHVWHFSCHKSITKYPLPSLISWSLSFCNCCLSTPWKGTELWPFIPISWRKRVAGFHRYSWTYGLVYMDGNKVSMTTIS